MTVRINKQKINLREKLTEFEDKVNFDEVVRGLGEYTGNVGIGTTNPERLLSVEGNNPMIQIAGAGGNGNQWSLASVDNSSGASLGNAGNFVIYNDSSGGGSRLTITPDGNIGIGSIDPSYKLTVLANATNTYAVKFDNTASTNANGLWIRHPNNAADNNSTFFLTCQDANSIRMRIYSDGDVWTSDSGTLTSDEQLKTNIVDATPKLEDIKKLKVRNFEWIPEFHPAKVGEKKIGFIAQELEQVFPGLVNEHNMILGEEEISRKSVRLGALIPILVKGMQEQQSIIEDLKSRIETLESK